MRASDTVKLNLKVRFVEPDNTCSEKNQSAEGAGGLGIIRSNKVGETE